MIQIAFDGTAFATMCGGVAAVITATAALVWACRRDPKGSGRKTAPSKLYWAGRPAMRVVQALYWLQDMLPQDGGRIRARLRAIFDDPDHGAAIVDDLRGGIRTLPTWMQDFLRDLLVRSTDRLGRNVASPADPPPGGARPRLDGART